MPLTSLEKKMNKSRFLVITLAPFFFGCANTANNGQAIIQKDMDVCMAAIKQSNATAIKVPAADNAISHRIAVTTVKMSGSSVVDALMQMLSKPSRRAIVVVGDNDEMTAATLETALQKLPESSQRSKEPVCFAGDRQFESALRAAAQKAQVNLVLAPNR
jgi:hypothetical protein